MNLFNGSQLLTEGELVAQLEKITNSSDPPEEPVGVLTSAERTFWAKQRKRLLRGTCTTCAILKKNVRLRKRSC